METIKVRKISDEYEYIKNKHGERDKDWKFIQQALMKKDGKYIDWLIIELCNGKRDWYFFEFS